MEQAKGTLLLFASKCSAECVKRNIREGKVCCVNEGAVVRTWKLKACRVRYSSLTRFAGYVNLRPNKGLLVPRTIHADAEREYNKKPKTSQ